MNIKEAAKLSGVSVRNIRFYEEKGLLAPVRNKDNDYREYTDADVRQLMLIRALRMVDMPLEKIREVVEGQVTLHDAATAQKEKLDEKIEQLKVATKFCAELAETKPEDVKEVLERMDQPNNRRELFDKWKDDHEETINRVTLSLFVGFALPIASGVALNALLMIWIIADELSVYTAGVRLFPYLSLPVLWGYTGYRLYEKKWWWVKCLLAHLCLIIMMCFSFNNGILYSLTSVVLMPYSELLWIFDIDYTSGWYSMLDCCLLIFAVFCLGMLIGKIKEVRIKRGKAGKSRLAQYFARHPRRRKVVKALVIVVMIVSIGSIKEINQIELKSEVKSRPYNVQSYIAEHLTSHLQAQVDGDELYFWIKSDLIETMSFDQWEHSYIAWGKGETVISIMGEAKEEYLIFYENDIVGIYDGKSIWGEAKYTYYRLPDGVVVEIEEYIWNNLDTRYTDTKE